MPVKVKTAVESRECAFYWMGQEKQGDIAFCVSLWILKFPAPFASRLLGKDPAYASQRIAARHIKAQL
jgi:hypothetical protein